MARTSPPRPTSPNTAVPCAIGRLRRLDATAATPRGPVSVRYRIVDEVLTADLELPRGLPGEFIWQGEARPLRAGHNRLKIPAPKK